MTFELVSSDWQVGSEGSPHVCLFSWMSDISAKTMAPEKKCWSSLNSYANGMKQAQWCVWRHSWSWVPFSEILSSVPSWEMSKVLIRLLTLALLANWTSESRGRLLSRTLKAEFLERVRNVISDITFLFQDPPLFICCILHCVKINFRVVHTWWTDIVVKCAELQHSFNEDISLRISIHILLGTHRLFVLYTVTNIIKIVKCVRLY